MIAYKGHKAKKLLSKHIKSFQEIQSDPKSIVFQELLLY